MATIVTVLSWLLGVVFLMAGAMKALVPEDRLRGNAQTAWVERTGVQQARLAGVAEMAAAAAFVGSALDVVPLVLAGVAAVGIMVVMALAALRVHRPAGEPILPNVVLGVLALVLAVGAFTV